MVSSANWSKNKFCQFHWIKSNANVSHYYCLYWISTINIYHYHHYGWPQKNLLPPIPPLPSLPKVRIFFYSFWPKPTFNFIYQSLLKPQAWFATFRYPKKNQNRETLFLDTYDAFILLMWTFFLSNNQRPNAQSLNQSSASITQVSYVLRDTCIWYFSICQSFTEFNTNSTADQWVNIGSDWTLVFLTLNRKIVPIERTNEFTFNFLLGQ